MQAHDGAKASAARAGGACLARRAGSMGDARRWAFPAAAGDALPVFDTASAAQGWYRARRAAVPPGTPPHLFWTATSWSDVERGVLPRLARPSFEDSSDDDVDKLTVVLPSVYRPNPDAVLNTLRLLFFHARCGIWVSVRRGRVAAFVPFANAQYVNTWSHKLQLGRDGSMSLEQYVASKARETHRPRERVLPPHRWWLNGGTVCNVMPEDVWGDGHVAVLRHMLDTACERAAIPDADFFLNKRDHPVLRDDGRDALHMWTGEPGLPRETYRAYAPVFSFYTGAGTADVPMPTTEDWACATGRSFPPGTAVVDVAAFAAVPHGDRQPRAVFRGTATGAGITVDTNVRLRLAAFGASRPDVVDAGVTGYNLRDKVVRVTDDVMCVDHIHVEYDHIPKKVAYMPFTEQVSTYRYVIYAEGHVAAGRYGTLMHSGSTILKVEATRAHAGDTWAMRGTVGARVDAGDEVEEVTIDDNVDHFIVDADLSNLEATVVYLRARPDVSARVAAAAKRKAPTLDGIATYWRDALRGVHALQRDGSCGKEWFGAADPQYARCGRTGATAAMTSF